MRGWLLPAAALLVAAVGHVQAADEALLAWPRFRGPDGIGRGEAPEVPSAFTEADYRWQAHLPGKGHSSPVPWGDRVLVTCDVADRKECALVCLETSGGTQLWSVRAGYEAYHNHPDNSFAAATPAVDAVRAYTCRTSGRSLRVAACDRDGHTLWEQALGPFKAMHGAGGSPAVIDGVVVVVNDQELDGSAVYGLDGATGEVRWQVARGSGENVTYETPTPYRTAPDGAAQIILSSAAEGLVSLDPRTGKTNWDVDGLFSMKIVGSPVVVGDIVFATAGKGGQGREAAAVRVADGGATLLYRLAKDIPYVSTPVAVGGRLYMVCDNGQAVCMEPENGRILWREKLEGFYYSSPIAAGNRIFAVNRKGLVTVFEAAPEFKLLGKSRLPEGTHATPAIADGCIYFRTFSNLVCIGPKPRGAQ